MTKLGINFCSEIIAGLTLKFVSVGNKVIPEGLNGR